MKNASTTRGSDNLAWFKSSYSTKQGGALPRSRRLSRRRSVHDSKNPEGPVIALSASAWSSFTESALTESR